MRYTFYLLNLTVGGEAKASAETVETLPRYNSFGSNPAKLQ